MRIVVFLLVLISFVSCKKAEDRNCWKSVGEETSLELSLPEFSKLRIGPKMAVVLVQDTVNKMIVSGGKKLINFISADFNEEGFLTIKNSNKCDFLRSYKKSLITIEIHLKQLDDIFFEGTHDLTTKGVLIGDKLNLNIQDSGATAYLNVQYNEVNASQGHGYGNFVLTGTCNDARLHIISNGFGDSRGLNVSNKLVVVSNTPVNTFINADNAQTTIEIDGTGDVIYVGTPSSLNVIQYGKGNVINGN
ncbi:MAG: DUF2807 domain-containing protein [Crocinitomicaceae bacterium]|nr:DUF2807 domain-containing protein [Crocinitomicaceae bacterium]